jgi:mannose-6-phosphate isomerase-like protein (cupin superfamily)
MAEPRYAGPLPLAQALSGLALQELGSAVFHRDGPRENFEYRDLGAAAATGGRIGIKHSRAIKPFEAATGWHWHDMHAHIVYVLKGSITFRFDAVGEDVVVRAGSCLSQPTGVAHNVVGYSDDLELIEINLPADYATTDLPGPPSGQPRG